MRLHSTTTSYLSREVTALAIAESLLASGITLWLAWRGRWVYLECTSLVTPLLMLRTPESTERGVRWFNAGMSWLYEKYLNSLPDFSDRLPLSANLPLNYAVIAWGSIANMAAMVVFSFAAKLSSTVTSLLTRPLDCLLAIPRNWFAQTFCIDSAHPPELVPGIETSPQTIDDELRFSVVLSYCKRSIARETLVTLVVVFICIPPFTLTLLYRLSLKGTAIVWLPLLWIVPKLTPRESVLTRLKLLNQTSWGRIAASLSVLTIVGFLVKMAIYQGKVALTRIAPEGNLGRLIQDYVAPTTLPPWQIVSVMNAVLAIAMFLWAGNQIVRFEDPLYANRQGSGDGILRTTSVLRAMLSLYTSSCLVYMAVVRAQVVHLPPLGDRLFPWSH